MLILLIPLLSAIVGAFVARKFARSPLIWTVGCFLFGPLLITLLQLRDAPCVSPRRIALGVAVRLAACTAFAYVIALSCDQLVHSRALMSMQVSVLRVFLPSVVEVTTDFTIKLLDGREYQLVTTGLQSFVAAAWGFMFGCAFTFLSYTSDRSGSAFHCLCRASPTQNFQVRLWSNCGDTKRCQQDYGNTSLRDAIPALPSKMHGE